MSLRHYTFIAAGAIALATAFPGTNIWQLAWIGCVPLLLTLYDAPPRRCAAAGLLFGLIYFGIITNWITLFGGLPWVMVVIYQAIFIAAFSLIGSIILRHRITLIRTLGVAGLWVSFEWLRSLGPAGFTWGDLAYSQAYNLPVARLASITGPWGISFLLMMVNIGIAEYLRARVQGRRSAFILVPIVFMAVAAAWGVHNTVPKSDHPLKVCTVQASIKQSVDPSVDREIKTWDDNLKLTRQAMQSSPDFIVWPESGVLEDLDTSFSCRGQLEYMSRTSRSDILTGYVHETMVRGEPKEQNGACVITPGMGMQDQYFKVKLVPFGEYVPARKWLGFAKRYGIREIDYIPGPGWRTMKSSHGTIGTAICFESIFPYISRHLVRSGAQMLFVLTNDAWFERTAAPEQHLQMAVFRAIENRRYVVRSASSGISAIISPDGTITSRLKLWQTGVLSGEIAPISETTPYTRYGDWFAYFSMILAVGGTCIAFESEKRAKKPSRIEIEADH